jgi:putative endonuclease
MNRKQKGRLGEKIASKYLMDKGYKVIEHNWTCQWGELDLIAAEKNALVIVEVKYSRSKRIKPQEQFTKKKQHVLLRTINNYLLKSGYRGDWRLDLVCVSRRNAGYRLFHYKNTLLYC